MAAKITGINGDILRWARERAGLSVDDVASAMKKDRSIIAAWESGDDTPTYVQLENVANKYKRPVAVFFFPEPPEDKDPKVDFRLLPDVDQDAFTKDTLFAIRQMRARQESLRELTDNRNPAGIAFVNQMHLKDWSEIKNACRAVRELLGITMADQYSWRSTDEALKQWRHAVEAKGVFIFKRSFKQGGISGFCLTDDVFPVVCINNSTAKARQIFTLFHEVAHLLSESNGVTKDDLSYVDRLTPNDRSIEIACNRFAAEFLVPDEALDQFVHLYDGGDESLEQIAGFFKVSKEVILRRLLDRGMVTEDFYLMKRRGWNEAYREKTKSGDGSYYANQAVYLGENYIKLGFQNYYAGRCNKVELSEHFDVKVRQIEPLESAVLGV